MKVKRFEIGQEVWIEGHNGPVMCTVVNAMTINYKLDYIVSINRTGWMHRKDAESIFNSRHQLMIHLAKREVKKSRFVIRNTEAELRRQQRDLLVNRRRLSKLRSKQLVQPVGTIDRY